MDNSAYVWELMLKLSRGFLLDLAWETGFGGVGHALAFVVLHSEGSASGEGMYGFVRLDESKDGTGGHELL